jgi:lipopolysaccharide biosynthesis protein
MGLSRDPAANPQFRRPCAGFNPQVYAQARPEACARGGANPLADWLRHGRPAGPWLRDVVSPDRPAAEPVRDLPAAALHAHLYYAELADDLRARLAANRTACALFLTTDTPDKARHLRSVFAAHRPRVEVLLVPNRGRDLAPFILDVLPRARAAGCQVVGHVHGKRSLGIDAAMGESWRCFLFEHLVGGRFATLDLARQTFAADPRLGLLMPEDPHLVGWNANRDLAVGLAARMGIDGLPDHFDFPVGAMFWARTDALAPLLALGLGWEDFPGEPVAHDGTLLHALERLVPFVVGRAGYGVKGIHVPGVTW